MSFDAGNLHVQAGNSIPLVSFVLFVVGNIRVCPVESVHCPPALQPYEEHGHKKQSHCCCCFFTEHVKNDAMFLCSTEWTLLEAVKGTLSFLKGHFIMEEDGIQ